MIRSRRQERSWFRPWGWVSSLLLTGLAAFVGCTGSSSENWQTAGGPPPTANELVERVRASYRDSTQYGDRGMLILSYTLQGTPQQERHPMSTVFDRNQASDLQTFALRSHWSSGLQQIAVFDPSTQNLGGQIVVRDDVSFEDQCAWPDDSILRHFASGRAELPLASTSGAIDPEQWLVSLPLALARDAQQQPWFLGERELIDTSFLDGRECYRLKVTTPAGRCMVWIDVKDYLVLRVEMPMSLLDSQLLAKGGVADPRLVLDLADAQRTLGDLEERLSFAPAQDAKRVTRFVSLPTPFPSETIGRRPEDSTLATLRGEAVQTASFAGRSTALFWFSSDPICKQPLQQFAALAAQQSGNSQTRFLAVCTDPPANLTQAALDNLLREWRIDPAGVVRDPNQAGKSSFDVRLLPTVEVLGSDGRVQFYKVIEDGEVATELVAVLDRLSQGHDIASEMRDEYRNYIKVYENQLFEAAWDREEFAAIRNASYAPRRMPERFSLQPLTVNAASASDSPSDSLKAPGNFGAIQVDRQFRLAILDGYQSLCLLGNAGEVSHRIALGSEPADNYTQVRGLELGGQAYWAVGSILGTRVKLIRDTQVIATIDVSAQSPIRDWLLADLDRNGEIELWIGHWLNAGIARYNAQGELSSTCTLVPNVASIAAVHQSPQTSELIVTSRDGGLFRVSSDLSQVEPIAIGDWQIAHCFATAQQRIEEPTMAVCLALDSRGTVHALGIDRSWRETWSQPLSSEVFQEQVEFVQHGPLNESTGLWAIARPDGSVHLLDSLGQWKDRFQVGSEIRGMAITYQGEQCELWISDREKLERWQVRGAEVSARSDGPESR